MKYEYYLLLPSISDHTCSQQELPEPKARRTCTIYTSIRYAANDAGVPHQRLTDQAWPENLERERHQEEGEGAKYTGALEAGKPLARWPISHSTDPFLALWAPSKDWVVTPKTRESN
ncbi:hypothetical protein N9L68_00490 [bacterium]|nr:hypothetical protein [bacterium]